MTISRVQGNASNAHAWPVDSLGVTLTSTPSIGNVLIAVIGSYNSYAPDVSSISQSGVSWARQVQSKSSSLYGRNVEIWAGVVSGSAPTSLTINFANTGDVFADVCEYSGLDTNNFYRDQAATAASEGTQTLTTGTTNTTTSANELWIGGIFNVCDIGSWDEDTPLDDGFTMLDGAGFNWNQTKCLAYLEKIVSSVGTAASGVIGAPFDTYEAYVGCIATFKASSGTVVVPYNGRYSGNGSKQETKSYQGSNVIVQLDSNSTDLNSNGIIENLIIDGQSQADTIGIQLQNVANCIIRNVTIMNCNIGIHLWVTGSNSMRGNRFEHIRMKNVKYGIVFEGDTTNKDFSYTTIDDVGISLLENVQSTDATGILVGTAAIDTANLDNAFIKATVWLNDTNGKGMEVKGRVKYSLVNLEVEQDPISPYPNLVLRNGKGLQVDQGAYVTDNQSFYLATGGVKRLPNEYRLYNNGTATEITNVSIGYDVDS